MKLVFDSGLEAGKGTTPTSRSCSKTLELDIVYQEPLVFTSFWRPGTRCVQCEQKCTSPGRYMAVGKTGLPGLTTEIIIMDY